MKTRPEVGYTPGNFTRVRNQLKKMRHGGWTNASRRWPECTDATIRGAVVWLQTSDYGREASYGFYTDENGDTIVYRREA